MKLNVVYNLIQMLLHHSRECLKLTGNTSSVAVIDILKRHFTERKIGDKGVLSAFGPAFTTEMVIGEWG
ncbi:hypothetical protein [Aliivibrio wodanis]|uniref:hypothetical protein n=1 Tax=Aliivibrio wodanis TaxID=80852 RepID=UPI00406C7BAC